MWGEQSLLQGVSTSLHGGSAAQASVACPANCGLHMHRSQCAMRWPAPPRLLACHLSPHSCPPGVQVGQTTLYIPVGLAAVYGNSTAWPFVGGFVG